MIYTMLDPTEVHYMEGEKKKHCLKMLFCVPQKKHNHTGLEQHEESKS